MNKSGVLTTEFEKAAYVGFDYTVPEEECIFVGRLVNRVWYNNKNVYGLVCNFITEDGRKIALFAFRHKLPNEIYSPRNCDIDFAHDVKDGTIWRCTHASTKYGKLFWKSAELISEFGDDSSFCYEKIQTYTQEQITDAIAKREQRKQEKINRDLRKEEKRRERQYQKDLKSDTWLGRRLRLVKNFREDKLTQKQMKEYATGEICFVISTDRKIICCPKGHFFNTYDEKGKSKKIKFPESCQDCDISCCQGKTQKTLHISNNKYTTEEMRDHYSDEEDEE